MEQACAQDWRPGRCALANNPECDGHACFLELEVEVVQCVTGGKCAPRVTPQKPGLSPICGVDEKDFVTYRESTDRVVTGVSTDEDGLQCMHKGQQARRMSQGRFGLACAMLQTSPLATAARVPMDASAAMGQRCLGLDALRGVAMVWMAGFHLCFDLAHWGLTSADFYRDPFWTGQRVAILGLFLFCAGMGQAQAHARGLSWRRFGRRWAQIALCALLVSVGSWWAFPQSFITFGVLHGMVVMLLLTRLLLPLGPWLWAIGAVALTLPLWATHPVFDAPWLQPLGLVTRKPITEDYVPLLPWWGVMLWGSQCGPLWSRVQARVAAWATSGLRGSGGPARARFLIKPLQSLRAGLAVLGRWSLSFYMLHQPLFWAVWLGWKALSA
jgi:uncharacterized membrane protein